MQISEKEKPSGKEKNHESAFVSILKETSFLSESQDEYWIMDSGASAHMTHRREYFATFEELSDTSSVKLGNNEILEIKGRGTIRIQKLNGNEWCDGTINNAMYVPQLRKNLFSEGAITSKGMKVMKEKNTAKIYHNGVIVAKAVKESNNLYRLLFRTIKPHESNVAVKTDIRQWHERLIINRSKKSSQEVL